MTNLVVLSYGRESEYRRAILAILSCYGWLTDATTLNRVVLFTDNADYFRPYLSGLVVDYRPLTPEKIRASKEVTGLIHRLKISIVEEVFRAYPGDNLFYVDSDTFVISDPAALLRQISPAASFMHVREYVLSERANSGEGHRFLHLIAAKKFPTSKGEEQFVPTQTSWNAGVLGLAAALAADIPDVFLLTDEFHRGTGSGISEQLAFSLVLQTRSHLYPSNEVVFHYWESSKKLAVDALLAPRLTAAFATASLADRLRSIKDLTRELPALMLAYLAEHPEITLREQAIMALYLKKIGRGYGLAGRYLLKQPRDTKFLKDVLYYTRQLLG